VTLPLFQVDAFTVGDAPFTGNPAAVVVMAAAGAERWMQSVAMEMNLSETAFVARRGDGAWDLRWFTPAVEVDLCGHATLATAHALWQSGRASREEALAFHTRSGVLRCTPADERRIAMTFPADPLRAIELPPRIAEAVGQWPTRAARGKFDVLIELPCADDVRTMQPDLAAIAALEARGLIVTAACEDDERYDFVSRFFAPRCGIDEDPVTGSAHCTLACWWSPRLGRPALRAYQASPRGGELGVALDGDAVTLTGRAVTVFAGELCV